jgi:2-polyprenyl-6-methoxyphenol hydroxylase-like FAD-dependent oxidoreductase
MRIAIIGGGIGGLTAALTLRQFGFEPAIFEQAPELLEVGAAILMWPNAMRILHRLGLAESIREHGGPLDEALWLSHDGRQLNRFRLPQSDEPAVALHRAELQQLLLDALTPESIHLGHAFEKFENHSAGMVAHFTNQPSIECDVLVAADGLHSRARTQLLNDGPPIDRGYVAWRGVAPYAPKSLPPASAIEIHGKGQRFGIGPLGSGKVGWWCSINTARESEVIPPAESPDHHERAREQLAQLFAGWCDPINELIQSTPVVALVRNPVLDRAPVRKWGTGCLTLIGDAIHPLTPNLGQGGCLAIEDAVVMARCLKKYAADGKAPAIESALRRFERLRLSRTATVARFSRLYGVVGQWENQAAMALRAAVLSAVPRSVVQRLLRWTFDYDAYEVTI